MLAAVAVAGALGGPAAVPAAAGRGSAATEVTADELRRLVERAASDPAAVSELRRVDRVDGRPVDLGRALAGSEGATLQARLHSLDPGAGAAATGAQVARDDARRILDGRRFNPSPVPRPFRGVLRRVGGWLRPVVEPLERLWEEVAGDPLAAAAFGSAVVGAAALATARLIRRRTSAGLGRARPAHGEGAHEDPDELERRAAAAERAGDLDRAVRLRFRAGLVRLARAGAIVDRPALTTGELTRTLPSPRLRGLTATFEEVAYGGRPATPHDVEAARAGWPRALDEASAP